jgi:hypothetical protein
MTKNRPENIAGFDNGIITLKNNLVEDNPRF